MTTFTYRDLRRQRLSDALAALQDDPQGLASRWNASRPRSKATTGQSLIAPTWRSLKTAVGDAWLLLKDSVNADLVFAALGTVAAITDEQAAAIETSPRPERHHDRITWRKCAPPSATTRRL